MVLIEDKFSNATRRTFSQCKYLVCMIADDNVRGISSVSHIALHFDISKNIKCGDLVRLFFSPFALFSTTGQSYLSLQDEAYVSEVFTLCIISSTRTGQSVKAYFQRSCTAYKLKEVSHDLTHSTTSNVGFDAENFNTALSLK